MKIPGVIAAACAALTLVACGSADSSDSADLGPPQSGAQAAARGAPQVDPPAEPSEELVVRDLIEGSGPPAEPGDELTVEYVGIYVNGDPFSNSREREGPLGFRIGVNEAGVSPAWEQGLLGMHVGGRRELIIPVDLIQEGGSPPESSPEDGMVYVIDLLGTDKPQ